MRHRVIAIVTIVVLSLIIGASLIPTYRDVRQTRLNRELIAAIEADNDKSVATLLGNGADANCRDTEPDTRSAWLRLLPLIHRRKHSDVGSSALMTAVSMQYLTDHYRMPAKPADIELLLQHGANPNLKEPSGWSPLVVATDYDKARSVELLLQFGADPNFHGPLQQYTALMSAVMLGDENKVAALIEAGADPNFRVGGRNALQFASGSNGTRHHRIADMLRMAGAK